MNDVIDHGFDHTATAPIRKQVFHYQINERLRVHCGCGASYNTLIEGRDHALANGHTLEITGEIRVVK